ncbi:MAG: alkaline phosphatase-like protein [Caproiciproducens sp.]|nr:alkaline phosphatase-like protein [Caproiciproducens sp.]
MQTIIINIMNQFGYFGIALLIAIENIFPPIPSEVILTFGGFMTTFTNMKIWGVILSATIGSVSGALVLYALGRWLNPERLERWLDGRIGKVLHLKKEDIQRAENWFNRRGKLTVFFCRFIPIVRSLISIPAGMARMSMGAFLLLTALGTAIWNVVLVYLGAFFGASWETAAGYMNTYSMVAAVVFAVLAVIFGILYYKKRIKNRTKSDETVEPVDNEEE